MKFAEAIANVDRALSEWETTKRAHGITPGHIAYGNRILQEEKDKVNK